MNNRGDQSRDTDGKLAQQRSDAPIDLRVNREVSALAVARSLVLVQRFADFLPNNQLSVRHIPSRAWDETYGDNFSDCLNDCLVESGHNTNTLARRNLDRFNKFTNDALRAVVSIAVAFHIT